MKVETTEKRWQMKLPEDEAHFWMLGLRGFGVVDTREVFLVQEYLIHLLPATVILLLLLCTDDLSGRNREDMNK